VQRLKSLTTDEANGKSQKLLAGVEKKLGMVPNIMRTMANSPAVLDAYLGFSSALAQGDLPGKLRESIALAVGEANACQYCVSAHAALGRGAGLSDQDIADSRRGSSSDRRSSAALAFARKIVAERGRATDEDLATLRDAGFNDGAIAEIVANVAINLFTNYFNHVAETEIDFPEAKTLDPEPACAC
jgi:uncharacterized peroxidase-related enzyme